MEFRPIASGSKGNAYLVRGTQESLLIEAGIPYKELQKALDFQVSKLTACLISHSHKDHSKAVKELLRAGVDCYMLEETKEELGLKHHRIKVIESLAQYSIGEFTVLPFDTVHDVESVGFLVQDSEKEKLLFATDTAYIRYRFNDLTIIAVECNYSEDILEKNILEGKVPVAMKKRLQSSHFSLANYKDFIRANDMSNVREIWLIHMSDTNSDIDRFKKEIQEIAGKPVYIP